MPEVQINFLAVGTAAPATIFIGALWYSPLSFGTFWAKAHGHSEDKLAQIRTAAGRTLAVSLVCYLVMASVLALLVSYTGVSTVLQGAFLGILVWLGFLATVGLTAHMFSEKRVSTYLLDAGHQLVCVVVMGVILTAWR
ncbi:MAG: DUF1761 domain-containing protein [Planctomycetota bacterium]